MVSGTEQITVLPALGLFVMSTYVAFLTFTVADSSTERTLLVIATCLFLGGILLTVSWAYFKVIHKTGNIERA